MTENHNKRRPLWVLGGDRRGVAGVEFAFALPVLLILTVGLVEIGRVINQTTMVQKALRNAASYAARHQFPLDSQTETEIELLQVYKKTDTYDGGQKTHPTVVFFISFYG